MASGDLAAWAAVIIAAAGIFGAWRAYQISRATRNDEIERDRRRQAAAVSGWMSYLYDPADEPSTRRNAVVITNRSEGAVYGLEVRALVGNPPHEATFTSWVCPPGEFYASWTPRGGDPWDLLNDLTSSGFSVRPYTKHKTSWRVLDLIFTDGSGTRWRRGPDGCLERVPVGTRDVAAKVDPRTVASEPR